MNVFKFMPTFKIMYVSTTGSGNYLLSALNGCIFFQDYACSQDECYIISGHFKLYS